MIQWLSGVLHGIWAAILLATSEASWSGEVCSNNKNRFMRICSQSWTYGASLLLLQELKIKFIAALGLIVLFSNPREYPSSFQFTWEAKIYVWHQPQGATSGGDYFFDRHGRQETSLSKAFGDTFLALLIDCACVGADFFPNENTHGIRVYKPSWAFVQRFAFFISRHDMKHIHQP